MCNLTVPLIDFQENAVAMKGFPNFKIWLCAYVGELQKPRGGGPIFFSAGGGPGGGSLQKFSLEFHRVIEINKKKNRKIGHLLL